MDISWKLLSLVVLVSATVPFISGIPQDAFPTNDDEALASGLDEVAEALPADSAPDEPVLMSKEIQHSLVIEVPLVPPSEDGENVLNEPKVEPVAAKLDIANEPAVPDETPADAILDVPVKEAPVVLSKETDANPVVPSDEVPIVPLDAIDSISVVSFQEKDDGPVVSREEREEESVNEASTALGVLQERVHRTEEILPCVGRALDLQTLVLSPHDAKDSVVTYASDDAFVAVDIPRLEVSSGSGAPSLQFQLKLQFRTDLPRGLLAFFRLNTDAPQHRVHFYLYLHRGHLAARSLVAGRRQTVFSELGGLHDNSFHSVTLTALCMTDKVLVTVDDEQMKLSVTGLQDVLSEVVSQQDQQVVSAKLWLGGVDEATMGDETPRVHVHALHGCLKYVQLLHTSLPASEEDATLTEDEHEDLLLPAAKRSVMSGIICKDMCIESNPCPAEARCINHYSYAVCDCSDLESEHKECGEQDFRAVTVSGGEYVSHRTQSWETRGHKKAHKVSFFFKTALNDSVLLFVRSLYPKEAYYVIGLDGEGKLRAGGSPAPQDIDLKLDQVELELGDGPLSPRILADDQWHKLVVRAYKIKETIDIDPVIYFGYAPDFNQACLLPLYNGDLQCRSSEEELETELYYFDTSTNQCEQASYTGCGGNANRFSSLEECQQSCSITGLPTYRPFEGCFQRVYVDGVDVLAHNEKQTRKCSEKEPTTLSLTTPRSHVLVPPQSSAARSSFFLKLQFKTTPQARGILAQGSVLMADTVDNWRVISNNDSHLTFVLGENILTVSSFVKVDYKNWNDFSLRINNIDVTLTLNGDTKLGTSAVTFTLISGVTLGGQIAALQSCLRHVEVDGTTLDLRYFLDNSHGVVFDNCALSDPCDVDGACLHGGQCFLSEESTVRCDCSKTTYHGNRCQFAEYPRSCEGYARLGHNTDGIFNIDLDGPGPRPAVPVYCSFKEEGTGTEVAHNIPAKLDVRNKGMAESYKLFVTYDDLSEEDLVALVDSSSSCEQSVTFDCIRSRLRLSSETWFSSPRMQLNTHFGSKTPGICPCREIDECVKDTVPCNCDLNDGMPRRDSGLIKDAEQLPVTAVYFINDPEVLTSKSKGQLTLGNLQCFKQAETEDAISLLDSKSFLEYSSSKVQKGLQSIQFGFRTSASKALLLHKPSSHPLQVDLRLVLTSEKTLELQYVDRSEQLSLKFWSPVPLNSASWQHVRIDLSQQQIKVTLNGAKAKLLDLDDTFKILGGELYFGGSPADLYGAVYDPPLEPGLIGCLRDFFLNDDRVTVDELLQHSPVISYKLGCSLSCDPNPCLNGALCKELPMGQFECECGNSFAEWGDRCENNLNDDSITLLAANTEMRYKNEFKPVSETWNPLQQDLTFGFRTRQLQGLLLFIIDHVQNFIQIHISKPNEVTILWNAGYNLQVMTVNTGNLPLNRGKLVQLKLVRDAEATTLNLLTQGELFSNSTLVGIDLLQEREYQQFPFGSEVPHPALTSYEHSPSLPSPFLKVLVGGAETDNTHGKVPGFIGCLSGLQIGSHRIKLTDRSVWTWSNTNYETGYYSPCEFSNPCQNDGVCLDVFLKNKELFTECDCTSTSYVGDLCDEEIAYRFHGEETLIFKELYNVFSQPFSLDFAFALDGDQPEEEEDDGSIKTILTFRDTPDDIAEVTGKSQFGLLTVGLSQSATVLMVVVQWPDSTDNPEGKIIEFDVADFQLNNGFRHHITVSLVQRALTLQLDGETLMMKKSTALKQENTPSQEAIVVGGTGDHPLELPEEAVAWANFFGCISNVQVRTADKKVYRPLEDYNTHANNSKVFTRVGLPHRTQCSAFKPPDSEEVEGIVLDIKSKAEMREVMKENFEPLTQEEVPYNDGSGIRMAGKIGGLIVGVVALSVFIYLCKITHREPKTTTNEIGLIETKIGTDTKKPPMDANKEKQPLLAQSVEMQEVKSEASGTGVSVKYEKETTQTKSEPPKAAKTVPEVVEEKEKKEDSVVPPALIVVEKPTDESVPVNAEVQKARAALDLLDPKDLEKSNTKLSESCEDVSETEEAKDKTVEGHEDSSEVSEAIDTALDAEETKKSETQ